jgi:DNA gyrase subunit A
MMERPDLGQVPLNVRAYIESLEEELERLRGTRGKARVEEEPAAPPEPSEPPTTLQVITISASGLAKRTARHLYERQHRGGMGIFDLDTPADDPPAFLTVADETDTLVLLTNQARAFRVAVSSLLAAPVRSRGQSLVAALGLYPGEQLAAVLLGQRSTYAALLSQRGWAMCVPGHLLAENLRPSNVLYDTQKYGRLVAACWARSDHELLLVGRSGQATRLAAKKVPAQGCLGIRLDPEDAAVALTPVDPEGGVFMIGADGKGTIRLMAGFAPVKAPGAGGKVALKTEHLVAAASIAEQDDLFIISRGGKLIRFRCSEVPAKEGVVQGVACMTLRADQVTALAVTAVPVASAPQPPTSLSC